jgi:hypothetical protein
VGKRRRHPIFRERLRGLAAAKALTRGDLVARGFGKAAVHMWWYGWNRPDTDSLVRLAGLLEVNVEYLAEAPSPPGLTPRDVVIRESLRRFLELEPALSREERALFETLNDSPVAQTSVAGWRSLRNDVVRPSMKAAREQDRSMARMTRPRRDG